MDQTFATAAIRQVICYGFFVFTRDKGYQVVDMALVDVSVNGDGKFEVKWKDASDTRRLYINSMLYTTE